MNIKLLIKITTFGGKRSKKYVCGKREKEREIQEVVVRSGGKPHTRQ